MSKITLKINGEVPLGLLSTAIAGFHGLVQALSHDVAEGANIEWLVVDLEGGSASATVVGISDSPADVDRVVKAYDQVAWAAKEHRPVPYSSRVREQFQKITSVLNGKVSEVIFEGDETVAIATEWEQPDRPHSQLITALGAVEGTVQTLSSRKGLRFTLYDSIFDRSVTCHLSAEESERERQDEMMRSVWDRRAIVQGLVTRDPITGRPIEVRKITDVIPMIGTPDFRLARGAFKSKLLPEEVIRRERDAG